MAKFFTLANLLMVFIFCLSGLKGRGQIYINTFTGVSACPTNGNSPSVITNATGDVLSRSTMICNATSNIFNSTTLNVTSVIDNASYIEFSASANAGYQLNLTSLAFFRQGSATAPNQLDVQYSTDGFVTSTAWLAAPVTPTLGATATWDFTDFSTIIGGTVTFRIYVYGTQRCDLSAPSASAAGTFGLDDVTLNGTVSLPPKFYRSAMSGDWSLPTTWESSTDNISWSPAFVSPSASDFSITIQTGHTVTVSTTISVDETIIAGTLQLLTGGVLTVNDGTGNDIDIENNGVLQSLSTNACASAIISGTSVINIATGGKIAIGDGVVAVGAGYETFATSALNVWNDLSVFEWNSPTDFVFSGNTYFPNVPAGVIPNFTINKVTGPIGGGGPATVNGLFTVNSNFALSGNGLKTLRDGITGTAQLTVNPSTGGYSITSPDAIIGGTVSIVLNQDLRLTTGVTIPMGSSVNISGISPNNIAKSSGGIFLVNGTADMNATTISNTGIGASVTVNGTLKTSNSNGLYGIGATVADGTINLNANSTIEYNASGPQDVQGGTLPSYYNVSFSGGGIKTLISNNNPTGTITVSGAAIFDAKNFTFGTTGTNLTMTGTSGYITGGGTTKPDAQGAYNLAIGTTIEFALNSATNIRLGLSPINYANIIVSGSNVSNASTVTGISFQNGGSFTVKTGATFKLENGSGFTGNTSTAISNANNPTIILENGSTIEYSGATNQTITNQIPYQNFTVAGSAIKTAPATILTIQGNLMKSGTGNFAHNGGTVLLNGTDTQSFAGLTYNNLILLHNTKTTTGNSTIIDSIKINSGTTLSINASDTIVLHSDATKTARMAQIDGSINYNTTGKFVVERYISAKRAWRFLSSPVNSSQTIKEAWQEGALNSGSDPAPGFGTQITSNRASWLTDGFDLLSAGSSMETYNPVTNNYTGITTTLTPFDISLGGYMIFIRGNRTAITFGSPVSNTVLRSAGSLFTGNQPNINLVSGNITPVNNPYASPLDLRKLSASFNVFFHVWDPNRGGTYGFGAFQTLSWNGTDYDVVPGNSGSYGAINNFIESGQAFFVSTLGADTSLQLNETVKGGATFTIPPFIPFSVSGQRLRTNLYGVNSDETTVLTDGVLNDFGDNYNNEVDGMDAIKIANFSENLSVKTGNKLLAIERRHTVTHQDTIFLNLSGVTAQQYRFEFIADKLDQPGRTAFLEDNYSHNKTPINLNASTIVNFVVINNAGSYAPGRFMIVFEPGAVLPVTFTSVKAYPWNKKINIEWKVENETNIKQYEVEKSTDGTQFTIIAVKAATAGSRHSAIYVTTDVNPVEGYNYYRITGVDINGETEHSNVVKVFVGNMKHDITVYPNPLTDAMIHLHFMNQPEGKYGIHLLNKLGQVIVSGQIIHNEGSGTGIIKWDYKLAHGMYQLQVTRPDGGIKDIDVIY